MTPEKWLSERVKESGLKQSFIACKTGISSQKLSASLTGRRRLRTEEFLAVCYVAGIKPEDYPVATRGAARNA